MGEDSWLEAAYEERTELADWENPEWRDAAEDDYYGDLYGDDFPDDFDSDI